MPQLTEKQKAILTTGGHLLVTGGPGSGKTTIAILKAASIAISGLQPCQSILFLSFARATVARIIEAIEEEEAVSVDVQKRIDVDTYHAFFWRLLRTHGYLVGLPRRLHLVTPPNEAIALSSIRRGYKATSKLTEAEKNEKKAKEEAERIRMAEQEGRITFSCFAHYVAKLLHASSKVRHVVAAAFPCIILDEFQDTSADQWQVVKSLGIGSTLIALADPEQRIFEFAGAEAIRLTQYRDTFHPTEFDLKGDNHRSKGTEIALFGNELLTGKFSQNSYNGVQFATFEANPNQAYAAVRGQTLQARGRRIASGRKTWTVAVLVPTRRMTRLVSDSFRSALGGMPAIPHTAAVELEGAILASEFLAFLLQQDSEPTEYKEAITLICAFYRGKDGSDPSKSTLAEADRIESAFARCDAKLKAGEAPPAKSLFHAIRAAVDASKSTQLTGDPDADWVLMRTVLDNSACPRLREMAAELRNVRLLERGTHLRQLLAADWRANGNYRNALSITRAAFVQEHFASATRPERGVIVMNMHKAKGKQFDEVVIFEGWPRFQGRQIVANVDRIVRANARAGDLTQARQNFRVSVTRAKARTTILTPKADPCILLLPSK